MFFSQKKLFNFKRKDVKNGIDKSASTSFPKTFYHQSFTDANEDEDFVNNEKDTENAFQNLLCLPVIFQSLAETYTEIDDDCSSDDYEGIT